MNVHATDTPVDPQMWEREPLRAALARRDMGLVYRLLGSAGLSQRRIAALTGQSQSEVSEIANGARDVQAYDLLARIADGLGVPRGHMGLAYTCGAAPGAAVTSGEDLDEMQRRYLLGLAGKLAVGALLVPGELKPIAGSVGPVELPSRVGAAEVGQIRAMTGALRAYDASYGARTCRGAILDHAARTEAMLGLSCPETVRADLVTAAVEARTLAGWSAHDLGRQKEAWESLTLAAHTAREAGSPEEAAVVFYHLGRVPLDRGNGAEALKLFRLGEILAQEAASTPASTLLGLYTSLAYAQLGDRREALRMLAATEDGMAEMPVDRAPFSRYFDVAAYRTTAARVYATLGAAGHRRDRGVAVERFGSALELCRGDDGRGRLRAFNLSWLASCMIAEGDVDAGLGVGWDAVQAVRGVGSARLRDALGVLYEQTGSRLGDSGVSELHHELQGFLRLQA